MTGDDATVGSAWAGDHSLRTVLWHDDDGRVTMLIARPRNIALTLGVGDVELGTSCGGWLGAACSRIWP